MTDLPVLYSFRRCPYAMRARLAVLSSRLQVELREIVLRDKALEFLEASPSATVPCLVGADGTVIDESLDVMLWALGKRDPRHWLSPETVTLDGMLALISETDGPFKTHLDRYKYDTRYADADRNTERTRASEHLVKLNAMLGGQGWLYGDRASLADYAILPFVRQFANTDRNWFDGEDWPHLKAWLERFEASDIFAAIMPKFDQWQAGDPPLLFGGT